MGMVVYSLQINMERGNMKCIDRNEIIRRRAALIRAGMRPAFIFNSNYRIKERININRVPKVESTTFRSPLISQVYFSVFCKGDNSLPEIKNHG